MTQCFLTLPHDSAAEPTMASMQEHDPAELQAVFAAVDEFNNRSEGLRCAPLRRRPAPAVLREDRGRLGGPDVISDGPFVEAPEYVGAAVDPHGPDGRPRHHRDVDVGAAVVGVRARTQHMLSSMYVRRDDGWKLTFHQQTPR